MAPLVSRTLRWLRLLLKYGMPGALVLVPLIALFGFFIPWQAASEPLSRYSGQSSITIGVSYRGHASSNESSQVISRSYLLFPSAKVVLVQRKNDDAPTIEEQEYGLVLYVLWFIVCAVGTWWFWIHPRSRRAL